MKLQQQIVLAAAIGFAGSLSLQTASAATGPWWDDFPRLVDSTAVGTVTNYHGTIAMNNAAVDPSWGTFFQCDWIRENAAATGQFRAAGLKQISYYETYGQSYCTVVEIGPWDGTNLTKILHTYWSWGTYTNGTVRWAGAKNFFDDEDFARPYTRTHPRYGGSPMTYPDGTVASGYNGADTDPRNSRVYDAGCSKDILANLAMDTPEYPANTNGLVPVVSGSTTNYAGLFYFKKDSACPVWNSYTYASTLQAADAGLDGMWTDNYGPWDSFGSSPVKIAFGEWSVARFRGYLTNHFSTAELTGLGVTNADAFDIREYIKTVAAGLGWDGTNLTSLTLWRKPAWTNDSLWRAYEIFKRQAGTEALSNYYTTVKSAALAGGKPEFLIAGNDIPGFQLGWTRGFLDMVSTEHVLGSHPSSGNGFLPPPVGRSVPFYKLAREHAQSRFVNVWFYNDKYTNELTHADLCNVLYYEMLATHTLPKLDPSNSRLIGSASVNEAFFRFVGQAAPAYGARVPVEDVGVYYSSSSLLRRFTPGGIPDKNVQPHQFAVWGWGTALGELHYQYRMVPEWKLTADLLATLRVLIVPNAEVFDPADTAALTPWVNAGGVLIVTGNSGNFLGESGNFNSNTNGYSLASLTSVGSTNGAPAQTNLAVGSGTVLYLRDNIGDSYYSAYTNRPALLGSFADVMNSALSGRPPTRLVATDASSRTGITLYQDEAAGKLFVDVNNLNIDTNTWQISSNGAMTVEVALPAWMQGGSLTASVVSPQAVPTAAGAALSPSNTLTVSLGPVGIYAGVIIANEWGVWRDAHFTTDEIKAGTADAGQDFDLDGYTNYQEFIAGTDPKDPASRLTVGIESGQLFFSTVSNRMYSLLSRTSLVSGAWSLTGSNLSGTGNYITIAPSNLEPSVFYRVEVSAP